VELPLHTIQIIIVWLELDLSTDKLIFLLATAYFTVRSVDLENIQLVRREMRLNTE
jgi:hypothetical protein